jgi:two-component system, NarL family, sensor histidine kinase DesK
MSIEDERLVPGTDEPDSQDSSRPERSRFFMILWTCMWLVLVLISPLVDFAHRNPGSGRLAVATAATVAFAAIYVFATWSVMTESVAWKRRPWIWTAILCAYAGCLIVSFGSDFIGAFLFVGVSAAMMLPERYGPAAVAAVSAITLATCLAYHVDGSKTAAEVLTIFMLGIAMTWVRRMVVVIHELRKAREQVARLAVNEERLRFARDLHDLLGHSLSTIALKIQVAQRMVRRNPDAAERELEEVEALTQRSLAEVREAVGGYRKPTLASELEGARSALAAAGIEASVRTEGTLTEEIGSVLAWTIREGVTNVIRHSGASRCDILVRGGGAAATVEITDDGHGSVPTRLLGRGRDSGSGLQGLTERVRAAGGQLETGRCSGGGFRLAASVPIQASAPAGTT